MQTEHSNFALENSNNHSLGSNFEQKTQIIDL